MRGHRLVGLGWAALAALALISTAFAREVEGRFGDGAIRIRPWMQNYNFALGLAHLSALTLLAWGAFRSGARAAFLVISLAALAVVGMLLHPLLFGGGPFVAEGSQAQILKILVF